MEIRRRIAITGCLAAASLALAACGGGSGSADYSGYVQAPAGSGNAPKDSKVQTPDTKGGNNGGGNNNDGSSGIAEDSARGGSD